MVVVVVADSADIQEERDQDFVGVQHEIRKQSSKWLFNIPI